MSDVLLLMFSKHTETFYRNNNVDAGMIQDLLAAFRSSVGVTSMRRVNESTTNGRDVLLQETVNDTHVGLSGGW